MTDRPINNLFPRWASVPTTVTMPDSSTQENVVVPDTAHQNVGWGFQEQPPFNYMNWVHNAAYNWLLYLDAQVNQFAPNESNPQALTLTINPGVMKVGDVYITKGAQTSSVTTAPTVHPRIDLYTIDRTGTLHFHIGTEDVSPTLPAIPNNEFPIAAVNMVLGQTLIINADITDLRDTIDAMAMDIKQAIIDSGQSFDATNVNQLSNAIINANAWTPMFILNAFVSPGTDPTTQFNISSGKMRDLSDSINAENSAITDASISSNTAGGGAVPAALFPITVANAGVTIGLYIFTAYKADGSGAYGAVDNQVDGSTILSDPTLVAAGYTYVRRIAMTYCPADGTMRPINQTDDCTKYADAVADYEIIQANSTTPLTLQLQNPPQRIRILLYMSLTSNDLANSTICSVCYTPGSINPLSYAAYNFPRERTAASAFNYESDSPESSVITDSAGNVNLVSNSNVQNSNMTVSGWIDKRDF